MRTSSRSGLAALLLLACALVAQPSGAQEAEGDEEPLPAGHPQVGAQGRPGSSVGTARRRRRWWFADVPAPPGFD